MLDEDPIAESKFSEYDDSLPRNQIANAVNPMLDKYINPTVEKIANKVNEYSPVEIAGNLRIPEISKGEDEQQLRDMPMNMATGMVGGIRSLEGRVMSPAMTAVKESMESRLNSIRKADNAMPAKDDAALDIIQSVKNLINTNSNTPKPAPKDIKVNQGSGRFGKIIVRP